MDLWIVAATAGAGYVAKANYLKNSTSRITENSLKSCSYEFHSHSHHRNLLQRIRDKTCPLCRLAAAANFSYETNGEAELQIYGNNKRREYFLDLSSESLPEFSIGEVGSSQRLATGRQLKITRSSGYILKPLNFFEYCLTAELYREQNRSEDYVYASLPSPSACTERPLTTGSSNNDMLLFYLGMTIGMVLTIDDNRTELDNLNELLKQNERLVHDLHDELEMKDQSTLKELTNGGSNFGGNSFLYGTPAEFSTRQESNKSAKFGCKELNDEKAKREIEAELEAELERLELNMKSSSLERICHSFQEDYGPDKVNKQPDILYDSEHESSGSSSDHTQTEIPVISPQELSLHLHQVVESRLKARIIELQAALENSQKRLQEIALELGEASCEEISRTMETDVATLPVI